MELYCSFLHLSPNRWGRWDTTDDFTARFIHFSLFSTALWDLANSRPANSMMLFPSLLLSALSSSPFHCALLRQTRRTGDTSLPLQFASLYDGQEVLVWSNCLLDLDRDFLVGNVVFVRDVQCLVPLQVNKSSAQCSSD